MSQKNHSFHFYSSVNFTKFFHFELKTDLAKFPNKIILKNIGGIMLIRIL